MHDYTSITADDVTRVTEDALTAADELVDRIVSGDDPTYAGTLALLDEIAGITSDAYGAGAFMGRVHPDPDVRSAGVAAEERLSKWGTHLVFRRDLYGAVAAFSATKEAKALAGTHARLLEFTMRDFRRAGHELNDAARRRLEELQTSLVELEIEFGRNLDEYEDGLDVTREQLDGASEEYISRLRRLDDGRFRVSMDYPDYRPFMKQVHDRDLRRELQRRFWNRAAADNRPLLEEAVTLRLEIARLLGHATWADYAMEVKMAHSPEAVAGFYASLVPGLTEMARRDLDTMATVAPDRTPDGVQSWDAMYLDNTQRKRDHRIDPTEVAAYFPLEQTLRGMLDLTGEVFALEYHRHDDVQAWHPDVLLYEIRDAGADVPLAYFYADLFPREGKYGHAAAFPIVYGGQRLDGTRTIPVSAIVANFTRPGPDVPSLLEHGEALTLFHEFGHILHFSLSTVDEIRFSGFDTEGDFVEAPSQIMENWMWEPAVLQRFARHHRTGEPIPEDLVKRLVAARDLNQGLLTMRQVFLGELDLAMHAVDHAVDLMDVYRDTYALTQLPFHEGTFFPASFGHLMGGYDAGYYGYLWSRVYGDDMFSVFTAEGITSPDVGRRYRSEVLARGGSRDAMEHMRAFLGREPTSDAFLRRLGLET